MKKRREKKERPVLRTPPATPARSVTVEVHYSGRTGGFLLMIAEGGELDWIPVPSFAAAWARIHKLYGREAKRATISLLVGGQ